jgi:hypothetical protein
MVTSSDDKIYILQTRTQRITLGTHSELTPDQARAEAMRLAQIDAMEGDAGLARDAEQHAWKIDEVPDNGKDGERIPTEPITASSESRFQSLAWLSRSARPEKTRISATKERETRMSAAKELHGAYRTQVELKRGERQEIDLPLLREMTQIGLHILAQPDPCEAMAEWFAPKQKRGKKATDENAISRHNIALAVEARRYLGMSKEKAIKEVAEHFEGRQRRAATVKSIYDDNRTAARATMELLTEAQIRARAGKDP